MGLEPMVYNTSLRDSANRRYGDTSVMVDRENYDISTYRLKGDGSSFELTVHKNGRPDGTRTHDVCISA